MERNQPIDEKPQASERYWETDNKFSARTYILLVVHIQIISQMHLGRQAELGGVSGVYIITYMTYMCVQIGIYVKQLL